MVLNPRREKFVQEYIATGNATEAAKRAGYSEHSAKVQGSMLLTNPDLSRAVSELRQSYAEQAGVRAVWVLERLRYESEHAKHPVARVRALELLGRHLDLFPKEGQINIDRAVIVTRNTPSLRAVITSDNIHNDNSAKQLSAPADSESGKDET